MLATLPCSLSHPNVLQGYTCTIVRLLSPPGGSSGLEGNEEEGAEAAAAAAAPGAAGSGGSGQLVPHLLEPESRVEVMASDAVLEPG